MFNSTPKILKKASFLIMTLLMFASCEKEVKISFNELSIDTSKDAIVAINYPKAEGTKEIADRINQTLEDYVSKQINLSEEDLAKKTINEAVNQFNADYNTFIRDFPDSSQKWEALIDGEVTYSSDEIISIALNTYLDTGGAHGNTNVRFFNFNPQTGEQLKSNDLVSNFEGLSELVEKRLKTAVEAKTDEPIENVFFGTDFKLPESLGFSDEGLIILYNPYEIASYAQGIIEFSIPYENVRLFLKVN